MNSALRPYWQARLDGKTVQDAASTTRMEQIVAEGERLGWWTIARQTGQTITATGLVLT